MKEHHCKIRNIDIPRCAQNLKMSYELMKAINILVVSDTHLASSAIFYVFRYVRQSAVTLNTLTLVLSVLKI